MPGPDRSGSRRQADEGSRGPQRLAEPLSAAPVQPNSTQTLQPSQALRLPSTSATPASPSRRKPRWGTPPRQQQTHSATRTVGPRLNHTISPLRSPRVGYANFNRLGCARVLIAVAFALAAASAKLRAALINMSLRISRQTHTLHIPLNNPFRSHTCDFLGVSLAGGVLGRDVAGDTPMSRFSKSGKPVGRGLPTGKGCQLVRA